MQPQKIYNGMKSLQPFGQLSLFTLALTFTFHCFCYGQTLRYTNHIGGDRVKQESTCKECTHNLIANPQFLDGLNNWVIQLPRYVQTAFENGEMKLCTSKGGGISQTVKGIIPLQSYRLSLTVKINNGSGGRCFVNFQFLDEKAQPVDIVNSQEITQAAFEDVILSTKAPQEAKLMRISIWADAQTCLSIQGSCLVQEENEEEAIKIKCVGQLLSPIGEGTIEKDGTSTCSVSNKKVQGVFQAQAGSTYSLKVKAKMATDLAQAAVIYLSFRDHTGKELGNPMTQAVSVSQFQLYTLSAVAPIGTVSVQVSTRGGECPIVEDWCISTSDRFPSAPVIDPPVSLDYAPPSVSNEVKLFPNPAQKHFTIVFPSSFQKFSELKIFVTNNLGQILLTKSIHGPLSSNTYDIDTRDWASGVYQLMVIPSGHSPVALQVVINRQ